MYGIYANMWGILMGSMLPYIAYMDPMGYKWGYSPQTTWSEPPSRFSLNQTHGSKIMPQRNVFARLAKVFRLVRGGSFDEA